MSNTTVERIEADIRGLPMSDQLRLMKRLAQHLHADTPSTQEDRDSQLAAMAADPDIRRELRLISAEFAQTETDGLGALS